MATASIDEPRMILAGRPLFVATIFAGSFLLFLVQPMIARMILPRLGGAPAVWNSAMLVYQLLLLGGYGYAHWLGRLQPGRQGLVHIGLFALAAVMLPIGVIAGTPGPDANVFLWVPWILLVSIGPLFIMVSAQAPLIQRWFAARGGGDPYPLYSASNFGSFCGLLAYPLLVEPRLTLQQQSYGWSAGYVLVLVLTAACAWPLRSLGSAATESRDAPRIDWRRTAKWVAFAAIPSGLMLSTTLHITTDIVAMPLLWVIPLGLYLLSFTIAFAERRGPTRWIGAAAPYLLILGAAGLFLGSDWWLPVVLVSLLMLLAVAVAIHARLFDDRPVPEQLTFFYLALSVGGAVGGIIGALIAPVIFNWTLEHPLWLVAAAAALATRSPFQRFVQLWDNSPRANRFALTLAIVALLISLVGLGWNGDDPAKFKAKIAALVIVAITLFGLGQRLLFTAAIAALMLSLGGWTRIVQSFDPGRQTRSFFGVYSVVDLPDGRARLLTHGTTTHGVQWLGPPAARRAPTSYYAPPSGAGLLLSSAPTLYGDRARVGIVGLGSGGLACYARPGQQWTFFEIDPAMVAIAQNRDQFTFLEQCQPQASIVVGDGRLALERMSAGSFDVLVMDAFSSDSVPMHLLTHEAFALYRRVLQSDGLLLVHISNRYLDLEPVVAAAARDGWTARLRHYRPERRAALAELHFPSVYIVLGRPEMVARLESLGQGPWRTIEGEPGFAAWTDDHASLLPTLRALRVKKGGSSR
jgi:SAM-dependent methyltransferase